MTRIGDRTSRSSTAYSSREAQKKLPASLPLLEAAMCRVASQQEGRQGVCVAVVCRSAADAYSVEVVWEDPPPAPVPEPVDDGLLQPTRGRATTATSTQIISILRTNMRTSSNKLWEQDLRVYLIDNCPTRALFAACIVIQSRAALGRNRS